MDKNKKDVLFRLLMLILCRKIVYLVGKTIE
jgi:hypothetical protein